MKRLLFIVPFLMVVISLVGCGASSKFFYKDPSFNEPINVAVLPFANETTDLAAGELSRILFALALEQKGFTVLDYDKTNESLQQMGITDGGQLGSIDRAKLQKELNVSGLVYGNLIEATYTTKGVVSTQGVTLSCSLYRDGKRMWEDQQTVKSRGLGNLLNPLQGLAQQAVDKSFQKAFSKYSGHPLDAFIESAVVKLQEKMPGQRKETSGWN